VYVWGVSVLPRAAGGRAGRAPARTGHGPRAQGVGETGRGVRGSPCSNLGGSGAPGPTVAQAGHGDPSWGVKNPIDPPTWLALAPASEVGEVREPAAGVEGHRDLAAAIGIGLVLRNLGI
jgi:hypothetical protein